MREDWETDPTDENGFIIGLAVEYIGEEMDALNPEVLGDEAAVGVEEGEEQVEGELFPLGLLSTVLSIVKYFKNILT